MLIGWPDRCILVCDICNTELCNGHVFHDSMQAYVVATTVEHWKFLFQGEDVVAVCKQCNRKQRRLSYNGHDRKELGWSTS